MDKIRIGLIGFGGRGKGLLRGVLINDSFLDEVVVTAVCDLYEDRALEAKKEVDEKYGVTTTFASTNWRDLLDKNKIDAIVIASAWESHSDIAIGFMEAGIPVGLEVGGAYSIDQCWQLVRTQQRTNTKFMFLENCCYGRKEMLCMNMFDQGVLGDITYCTGAYIHDLRDEICGGFQKRHYRLRNFMLRNCDNYPTHDLGPISKILGINYNNRMLTLTSSGSKAASLENHVKVHADKYPELQGVRFNQSDFTNTNIKCANGELINLTFGTSSPRPYSRMFTICGTKGTYMEDTKSVYLDRDIDKEPEKWQDYWDNQEKYFEEFDHPLWKKNMETGIVGGHGGMDGNVFAAFFQYLRDERECPIDVYDAASWMCISTLSEQSIALGGAPVAIPDFTEGKWLMNANKKTPLFGI